MGDEAMEMNLDDAIADAEKARDAGRAKRGGRGGRGGANPPLPPGPHPGSRGSDDLRSRLGGRGGGRGFGGRDGGYQKAPTLPGWAPSGNTRDDGKDCFAGKCEGCGVECEVFFRPVKGGNPPVCHECHQSLRAVQDQSIDGGGGPDRGRRGGHNRYNPYGREQMAAMQAMMGHMYAAAQAARGRGRGRGRGGRGGRSNVWVRPGSENDAGAGGEEAGGGDVAM
jgi:eukaryotic translation initiation factor 2C